MTPSAISIHETLPQECKSSASTDATRHKLALGEIKKLYFNQRYKQCIASCDAFLRDESQNVHPVQQATILFFAGLAQDTQARNASLRSPLLHQNLEQAEKSFREAAAILPALSTPSEELHIQRIEEGIESPCSSRPASGRSSLGSQNSTPTLTSNGTTISEGTNVEDALVQQFSAPYDTLPAFSPSALTFGSGVLEEMEPLTPAQRYNQLLTTLHLLINKHITSIASYRRFVEAAQDREHRFGALSANNDMATEEKLARIARGRANGWKRSRFNSQRYQELCDRALGEL